VPGTRVSLKVEERIGFTTLLPQRGDYLTLCLRQSILEKTKLTAEEVDKFRVRTAGPNRVEWDESRAEEKEVEFADSEIMFIADCLRRLNDEKQLELPHLGLYRLFVVVREDS